MKPEKPSMTTGANFTERVAFEHQQKQYENELDRWRHTLMVQTKVGVHFVPPVVNPFIRMLYTSPCSDLRVGLDCQKRSEEQIIRVPYHRSEMTVIDLVCVRNVLSICCHLANVQALPVKILVPNRWVILH